MHQLLPTYHITHRSLSTALVLCTIHIESLAEGHNVNRILADINVNPAKIDDCCQGSPARPGPFFFQFLWMI